MKKQRYERMPDIIVMGIFLCSSFGWSLDASTAKAAVADHPVINEVQIEGAGGTEDDWVELYNPTAGAIDLAGWSIQKSSASGGSIVRQALNGTVPGGGHYLIVRNGASTTQALKDAADLLVADTFSLASNNVIYLADNNVNVVPAALDSHTIDYVGLGTASFFEGAPAANPGKSKSISRVPDGEDANNNSIDFALVDFPTPQNAASHQASNINGIVLLTINFNEMPVQNITPISADIVFSLNANGNAKVNYGLTSSYGSSTVLESVLEGADKTISLSDLVCNTTYHYSVYGENSGASETDNTADATFTTQPCGIALNSLTMTKQSAKANNAYADGWQWNFDITIWNPAETTLKIKFDQWSGASALNAGANMQFSVNNGLNWLDITANGAYPSAGADLTGIDDNLSLAGRQATLLVRMKVPSGTKAGNYYSNYGILTE